MNFSRLRLLVLAGLVCGGIGAAAVQFASAAPLPESMFAAVASTPTPAGPAGTSVVGRSVAAALQPLADFLGISTTDLQSAFKNGQSLAQIAQAHGKSTDDLKTFLTSQVKSRLDKAVAAGKMTSDREATMVSRFTANLDRMINATHNRSGRAPTAAFRGFGQSFLAPIAGFLGMSSSDLQAALRGGQTLAQVASAHGKSTADLKAFLLKQDESRIDHLISTKLQNAWANHRPGTPRATPGPAHTAPAATN